MTFIEKALALCIGMIVLLLALGSLYQVVPPGSRGVSVTLGKVYPDIIKEGFTLKKPFIESINLVPIKQLNADGQAVSFSSDLQTVTVTFVALYRLPEDKIIDLYRNYAGDPYASLVAPRILEAIKQVAAQYKAEELVKNRDVVKHLAFEKVGNSVQGLVILNDLIITNIDLTNELEKAIELKQVKEQEALAKEYDLKKAQKDAEITVVNAKAEAESVKIKGQAITDSPKVIELEIAKRWDGRSPQSVVVTTGGANVLMPLK